MIWRNRPLAPEKLTFRESLGCAGLTATMSKVPHTVGEKEHYKCVPANDTEVKPIRHPQQFP